MTSSEAFAIAAKLNEAAICISGSSTYINKCSTILNEKQKGEILNAQNGSIDKFYGLISKIVSNINSSYAATINYAQELQRIEEERRAREAKEMEKREREKIGVKESGSQANSTSNDFSEKSKRSEKTKEK